MSTDFLDEETLRDFLSESWENLGKLDNEIVSLEKEPANHELLASIFRTIHTIKGSCGFVGLTRLGDVSHSAENVLGRMRDGTLDVSPPAISMVLEAVDRIKELLEGIEKTGNEPEIDSSDLIHKLDLLASLGDPPQSAASLSSDPDPAADMPATAEPSADIESEISPAVPVVVDSAPMNPVSEPIAEASDDAQKQNVSAKVDLSIRVNVQVLDQLMNLVGELVLTRNQLLQMSRGDEESRYAGPITHLNRVTTDLQEGVMKTRMQPIGHAWSKLPRLVRDLSNMTGKQIELEMAGAETELDRTVLDAIKDPLTHMVRNSADHGIESPEERLAQGKMETGKIRLNAYHEGGHVIICIEDDGQGIDTQKVLKKAIERQLVAPADAARLSEREILRFIFMPGFSTAQQVSAVSGRGVGMDVVRTQIERIGGTVDLNSQYGHGTTIRIKIPLTLAIISALIVESGGESFAIPQLGVVELVRLAAEDRKRIESIHNKEVFRLRDRLLPLVYLNEVLELEEKAREDRDTHIVVVQVGEERFGLIVSEVFDTEEIVVKPLGRLLKDVGVYQGTTILGDGRVVMILDVAGVANRSGGAANHTTGSELRNEQDLETRSQSTNLLLFDAGQEAAMAVPLSLVSRLEEFPVDKIERAGNKMVVQYRGELLPLMPVAGGGAGALLDPQPVLVFSEGWRSMGLLVHKILDIVDEELIIRMRSERPGLLGTAIINGQATDIIDTKHYITEAHPDWFQRKPAEEICSVALVDDSAFFRQLVITGLEIEGYEVHPFPDARAAMNAIEAGKRFDVMVSDIEMPDVDGYQLTEWVKARNDCRRMPVLMISSLTTNVVEQRALRAGADRFLPKSNVAQLIDAVDEIRRTVLKQQKKEASA